MSNFDFSNLSSNNNNDDKDFVTKIKEIATIMLDNIVKYSKLTFETVSPILKEKSGELAVSTKKISKKMSDKQSQRQKEKKVYLKYKTINKIYDDYKDSILDLENEVKEANKKEKKEKNQEQTKDKSSIASIVLIAVISLVIIFKFIISNLLSIVLILLAFAPLLLIYKEKWIIKNNKTKLDKVAIFRPDLIKIFEKMALYIADDELYDFIKYYQSELINLETFLNIKLDANQIELSEDEEDGELHLALSNIAVNQNSKVFANTLDDIDMNRFNIATKANYLIDVRDVNKTMLILFDNWLTDYLKIGKAINIKERIELLGYLDFFETGEEFEEVDLSRFSKKGRQIINKLRQDDVKEKLGMYPHDAFAEGIIENKYFIKIRMVLQNTNKAKAKSLLNEIGLITGITPSLIDGENDKTIYLKFKYKVAVKSREFKFKDILEQAKVGVINIGATDGGDYVVKYPRKDDPFFALIGGLSRSGKSTLASRMIATALYLSDGDGFYDYQDVFIASVKAKDDYFPLKWEEKGMFITDNPIETYKMLLKVYDIGQKRAEIFRENGCVNIKQYNDKFKNNKMGKILLVMDEYRNTLDAAERLGKVDVDGSEIKNLSLEIEKLYTSINTLQGSRGVNTICITQKFAKNKGGLGMVADSLDSRFLGYAEADVWGTQDKTETIARYLKSKSEKRKGLFLINASAFQQANPDEVEVDKIAEFVETRTHFIDTQEIADNFDRYFDTDKKYGDLIRDNSNNTDDDLESIIITKDKSEEVKENEEKAEESKTIEDFDFDDFNL
ncbi:TPA: hypothetical protein IUX45_002800 [Enterococcus faecalis]|uniref:Uncharacterized protein n=4 Tax=Bacilli TaxID=91061 RepID=A0A640MND7_BACAN|nr:hypothetical protein [Enterococcus faecalis]GEU15266.1 hypothetical protein QuyetLC_48750 [Bacillus anthracis]EKE4879800.1 hypothetical protein [Enterococcus faecalis]MDN3143320.1 hypothetical protein [Enterococcus faecalis]MDN3191616.1 hypothetical protein [Enterococcus faecalis]MEB6011088.1 hypothetical protein [Enterococcus faecalis]